MTNRYYSVLFLQCAPSQIDSSFYSELSRLTDSRIALALMHTGGSERIEIDPELGVVPLFPDLEVHHKTFFLPSLGMGGLYAVIRLIRRIRPKMIVVQDQDWFSKIFISILARLGGVKVIMRSDKNTLSTSARTGILRTLESFVVKIFFNGLAPVSKLTQDYYGMNDMRSRWYFPYPSSRSKFGVQAASPIRRRELRYKYSIPNEALVYLAVVKFVERENPEGLIHAFAKSLVEKPDAFLLLVGSGPLDLKLRSLVVDLGISSVKFCGYVPYIELQDYFWSADVFVHLARFEPWGVSAQDALVSNLGLVTSTGVGAGQSHLTGNLSRFVIPPDDSVLAAHAMVEASAAVLRNEFDILWKIVDQRFTAEGLACLWFKKMGEKGWI